MSKLEMKRRNCLKRARADSSDTCGFRGAGATWQASFGMALDERDLLFSVRREPVANRIVFQVAHDIFDNWFRVEELGEKPDPGFNDAVQKVLDDLSAKSVFTEMAAYERLFGCAIIAMTFADYGEDSSQPLQDAREIRELLPYSSLQFSVQGLGIEVVVPSENQAGTTTSCPELVLSSELPSVEETLKFLAGAMAALKNPGLEKVEILRLRSLIRKLGHRRIADTMNYISMIHFSGNELEVTATTNVEEDKNALLAGFVFETERSGIKLWRRPKRFSGLPNVEDKRKTQGIRF